KRRRRAAQSRPRAGRSPSSLPTSTRPLSRPCSRFSARRARNMARSFSTWSSETDSMLELFARKRRDTCLHVGGRHRRHIHGSYDIETGALTYSNSASRRILLSKNKPAPRVDGAGKLYATELDVA